MNLYQSKIASQFFMKRRQRYILVPFSFIHMKMVPRSMDWKKASSKLDGGTYRLSFHLLPLIVSSSVSLLTNGKAYFSYNTLTHNWLGTKPTIQSLWAIWSPHSQIGISNLSPIWYVLQWDREDDHVMDAKEDLPPSLFLTWYVDLFHKTMHLHNCTCVYVCGRMGRGKRWRERGGEKVHERERRYVKANLFLVGKSRCGIACYHRKTRPWGRMWLLSLMKKTRFFFSNNMSSSFFVNVTEEECL